jgi:5'-deoxynucleotidase YfbR-like HD superfamily hydrolase
MPPAERIARRIAFLVECDRLKDIVRQTLNAHSDRPENDAEHSWALCLFVMTLAEHNKTIGDGSAALWTHLSHLLDEAVQAGHVRG